MRVLNDYLAGKGPARLFIDARDVRGASIEVSGEWARWLSAHKVQLREISMLTGSRFIEVAADFVRRFAIPKRALDFGAFSGWALDAETRSRGERQETVITVEPPRHREKQIRSR